MTRRLNAYVNVDGEWYGPDSKVPAEAAAKIGDHAWEDDSSDGEDEPDTVGFTDPGAEQPPTIEAPPRSGRGSGVEAWRTFADHYALEYAPDATREDIIAAAEDADLIEREE